MKRFIHIPKTLVQETTDSVPQEGKRVLEPLKALTASSLVPLNILENVRTLSEAEIHGSSADLWHCLSGEITFTCGGELMEASQKIDSAGKPIPGEYRGKNIANGEDILLCPGDWLWIPAGVPHQHQSRDVARLVIIKIPDQP